MFESWRNLAHDTVSLYVRIMSIAIGLALFVIGWDLVMSPTNRELSSGVYDVVRQIAPLATWGVMMWLVAMTYMIAAISGRFAIYALAMVWSVATQGAWFFAIIWAEFTLQTDLSSMQVGLWILALSLTIGTAFVPHPLRPLPESTIQLLDENEQTVVELKRTA